MISYVRNGAGLGLPLAARAKPNATQINSKASLYVFRQAHFRLTPDITKRGYASFAALAGVRSVRGVPLLLSPSCATSAATRLSATPSEPDGVAPSYPLSGRVAAPQARRACRSFAFPRPTTRPRIASRAASLVPHRWQTTNAERFRARPGPFPRGGSANGMLDSAFPRAGPGSTLWGFGHDIFSVLKFAR